MNTMITNRGSISPNVRSRLKAAATPTGALVLSLWILFGLTSHARAIEVGDKAPDFELESTAGGKLKLSNFKGKNVLINFYVLDFSPT